MAYDYTDADKYPADPTGTLTEYTIAVHIYGSKNPNYQVILNTYLGEAAALRRAHYAAMQALDWELPYSEIECRVESSQPTDKTSNIDEEIIYNGN